MYVSGKAGARREQEAEGLGAGAAEAGDGRLPEVAAERAVEPLGVRLAPARPRRALRVPAEERRARQLRQPRPLLVRRLRGGPALQAASPFTRPGR